MSSPIAPTMDVYSPHDYVVEYDFARGARSQMLKGMIFFPFLMFSLILPIVSGNVIALFMPTIFLFLTFSIMYLGYSRVYSQKCVITSTEICITVGGPFSSINKILPLDTVLEVNIYQGCTERMFACCVINIETSAHEVQIVRHNHHSHVVPVPEGVLYAPVNAAFIRDLILKRREARRGLVGIVQMPFGVPTVPMPIMTTTPMPPAYMNPYPTDPYGYNNGMTMMTPIQPPMATPMQPGGHEYGMNLAPPMPQYPPVQQQQPLPYNSSPVQQLTTPYTSAPPAQQPLLYNTNPSYQQQPLPYAVPGAVESTQQEIERLRAQVAHLENRERK